MLSPQKDLMPLSPSSKVATLPWTTVLSFSSPKHCKLEAPLTHICIPRRFSLHLHNLKMSISIIKRQFAWKLYWSFHLPPNKNFLQFLNNEIWETGEITLLSLLQFSLKFVASGKPDTTSHNLWDLHYCIQAVFTPFSKCLLSAYYAPGSV